MITETAFAVVGVLLVLADLRATLSQVYHSLYLGLALPNAIVGGVALAILGGSFAALGLAWLGGRRAIGTSATVLAGATLLLSATRAQWPDLVIGAVACAAGLSWLALIHVSRVPEGRSPLPVALPLALAIDLALRVALNQSVLDLPVPASLAIVLAACLLFLGAGLVTLAREREWAVPSWRGALGLFALPPLLLVAETGGLNAAQVAGSARLGLGPEEAGSTERVALLVGLAAGAALVALARGAPRMRVAAAVALAAGATLIWLRVPVLSLAGAATAFGCVAGAALLVSEEERTAGSPARGVVALAFGWLLFGAAAFMHFAFYDFLPVLAAATLLAAVTVLLVP
ncbi:MAG: hypothetical protein FJ034_08195, partial [Chloroflexi bacterium]|nr:hypothetical protein [Chloroflexota bacterium]